MGEREVLDQLLVRGSLLEGSQILTVEVLHQRPFHGAKVVGGTHHRRHHGESGTSRSAPPPLTGDQLVTVIAHRPHQHGLQHTDLADRGRQLGQRLLVEVHTRLVGIGHDAAHGDVEQAWRVASPAALFGIGGNECAEAFTESAQTGHR